MSDREYSISVMKPLGGDFASAATANVSRPPDFAPCPVVDVAFHQFADEDGLKWLVSVANDDDWGLYWWFASEAAAMQAFLTVIGQRVVDPTALATELGEPQQ